MVQINQLMVEQLRKIKSSLLAVGLLLGQLLTSGQTTSCDDLKTLKNISKKDFNKGDTIKISFINTGKTKIEYLLLVMMLVDTTWYYSDYYTRYFNRVITYEKLKKILDSDLPYSAPKNYYTPSHIIEPNKVSTFNFVTLKKETDKVLIRFRIDEIEGKDGCDLKLFEPFYFVQIK